MKLPIPTLLYLVAVGLFAYAAWTAYDMLPLFKDSRHDGATRQGQEEGFDGIGRGKGEGQVSSPWKYGSQTSDWWKGFKQVNLIGKLPPPPEVKDDDKPTPPPPPKPVTPLEEIVEIISIVYDGQAKGRGGDSHVIVRYKPDANVQPPEWWVRENTPPGAVATGGPRDVAPPAQRQPQPGRPGAARPTTPAPVGTFSMMGRETVQKLWIDGGDDPRRTPNLWPPYSHIKLVGTAPDAQSAFFVREPAPPKEGEVAAEPAEEELLKTSMNLSQDVLRELRRLEGRDGEVAAKTTQAAEVPKGAWVDVEETTQIGGVRHIGRKDEQRFREQGDEMFAQLNLDTYVSQRGDVRGLQVRNVDPQLSRQFGVGQGDVLLEVNGRPVRTKAQAIQQGKQDYERGVRTFVTKWLSNGQVIERTYQVQDR
jgi:hypothetical protein